MALIEEAHKGARLLLDHAYVRILARAEPDATCAAALLAHALRRENVDFHVSWVARLDREVADALAAEAPDCLVLVGLSGDAEVEGALAARALALDREPCTLEAEAVLDPRHAAEANVEASLAALAHLVGVAMAKRNRDLAPLAIAGALAQGANAGGLRGLDAEVLGEALEQQTMMKEGGLSLHGPTLLGALSQLDAPFVAGVTGRARNVKKLLHDLDLNGDATPGSLDIKQSERLGSFLALRLLQAGAPDAALDALYRPRLRALQGPHTGLEAGELARVVEAACGAGRCGLAFGALWPDPASGGEALDVAAATREELVAALLRAEREPRPDPRVAATEAPRASLAGPLALRLLLATGAQVALAHHADERGIELALCTPPGGPDAAALARRAAQTLGGRACGTRRAARLHADGADATRAVKAVAEAMG